MNHSHRSTAVTVICLLLWSNEALSQVGAIRPTTARSPGKVSANANPGLDEELKAKLQVVPLSSIPTRPQDQIWMISTRKLCSSEAALESLVFRQRIQGDNWHDASLDEFLVGDGGGDKRPTLFYVHGNRVTPEKALRRGLLTYQRIILDWQGAPPIRFVIFTWPSDEISGQIRDVRTKACRADEHAFHLARLLAKMEEHREVSLIGHSFGGRLSIGALHLLGGGSIHCKRLPMSEKTPPSVNLTLTAPAIRNDCFSTTRTKAMTKINHLFVMHNSRDEFLKFFRLAKFDGRNPALGLTGLLCHEQFTSHRGRIEQLDVTLEVGIEHAYLDYLVDERVSNLIRRNLFFSK